MIWPLYNRVIILFLRQDSLMASATASATPKTDEDIIKDLLNEIMEKVDALTDKGRI